MGEAGEPESAQREERHAEPGHELEAEAHRPQEQDEEYDRYPGREVQTGRPTPRIGRLAEHGHEH